MLGRRPRKVDCAGVSAASDVAVVMTLLLGHVDGEKWLAGFLVLVAFRHWQLPDRASGG